MKPTLNQILQQIRHKAIELTIKILVQSTFSPWFRWPKSPPFSALLDIAPAVSNRGAILRSLDRPPSRCSGKRNPGSTASRIFADGFRWFSLDSGMWYQPQMVFLTRWELDQYWVGNSTVPKNIKGFGYISSRCPFFCLAHAPSVCTKTSAARKWQIWSAKWCWFQLPTQWHGYQIGALMTCTPWAHLFLQKADGSRCFAIWTAEPPGWVTPSSAQQVSMPLETLLLQI